MFERQNQEIRARNWSLAALTTLILFGSAKNCPDSEIESESLYAEMSLPARANLQQLEQEKSSLILRLLLKELQKGKNKPQQHCLILLKQAFSSWNSSQKVSEHLPIHQEATDAITSLSLTHQRFGTN